MTALAEDRRIAEINDIMFRFHHQPHVTGQSLSGIGDWLQHAANVLAADGEHIHGVAGIVDRLIDQIQPEDDTNIEYYVLTEVYARVNNHFQWCVDRIKETVSTYTGTDVDNVSWVDALEHVIGDRDRPTMLDVTTYAGLVRNVGNHDADNVSFTIPSVVDGIIFALNINNQFRAVGDGLAVFAQTVTKPDPKRGLAILMKDWEPEFRQELTRYNTFTEKFRQVAELYGINANDEDYPLHVAWMVTAATPLALKGYALTT